LLRATSSEVFVAKLDSSGQKILFAT